jgi:hypothetical protein
MVTVGSSSHGELAFPRPCFVPRPDRPGGEPPQRCSLTPVGVHGGRGSYAQRAHG